MKWYQTKWFEDAMANAFAFVMTFLMLYALCAGTNTTYASERVILRDTVDVMVFSTDAQGTWHSRLGKIEKIADGDVWACFELPNNPKVQCFVTEKDGDFTAVIGMRLLGEAKT